MILKGCEIEILGYLVSNCNPLRSNVVAWQHRSESTLAQLMTCLTAPIHYLDQSWEVISEVLWHSHRRNFTGTVQDNCPWYKFEYIRSKITAATFRGWWVKWHQMAIKSLFETTKAIENGSHTGLTLKLVVSNVNGWLTGLLLDSPGAAW